MISANLIPFTLMLSGLLAALPLSEAHPRQVLPLTDSHQALPLFGMGGNTVGQLGDETADNHNIPILIAGAAVYAAGGNTHSLFVRSDGSLWAMGSS